MSLQVCVLGGTGFIGQEIVAAFRPDNISQIGHIFGGMCGAFFGFRQRYYR
jgi:hypothetical protein